MIADRYRSWNMLVPLGVFLGALLIGSVWVFLLKYQLAKENDVLKINMQALNRYLTQPEKIPAQNRIVQVKKIAEHQKQQKERIIQELKKQQKESPLANQKGSLALSLREKISELKAKYNRESLGFEDIMSVVPDEKDVPDLSEYLLLIESFLDASQQFLIKEVYDFVRLDKKDVKDQNAVVYEEFPVLITFRCPYENLIRLLYFYSHSNNMIVLRSLSVDSGPQNTLDVMLKLSLLEVKD